jgi:hypothetical protein
MRYSLSALALALLACGCASAPQQAATEDPPPVNYRQLAAAHLRETLNDPWSVRDAQVAPPKRSVGPSMNSDGFTTPWIVCVRANAKNKLGAYTGPQHTAIGIRGGQVVNSWDEAHASATFCAGSPYEPFPELMAAAGR